MHLARAVHHVPQAPRGQGAMPLGLASNEGLGVARGWPLVLFLEHAAEDTKEFVGEDSQRKAANELIGPERLCCHGDADQQVHPVHAVRGLAAKPVDQDDGGNECFKWILDEHVEEGVQAMLLWLLQCSDAAVNRAMCNPQDGSAALDDGKCVRQWGRDTSPATPNVRGEAGPTALRLARAVHHEPQAPRGQGAMPLGLASTEGLGHAREAACGQRARR